MERLQQLREYLKDNPGDPFLRYAIALEYIRDKRFPEALSMLESLVEESPGYLGTYYQLGKIYSRLGRKEDAEKCYSAGMEIAMQQDDRHTYSELQNAKTNLLYGLDDEDA